MPSEIETRSCVSMHYLLFLAALRWTTTTVIHIRYFERKQVLSTALALVPRTPGWSLSGAPAYHCRWLRSVSGLCGDQATPQSSLTVSVVSNVLDSYV